MGGNSRTNRQKGYTHKYNETLRSTPTINSTHSPHRFHVIFTRSEKAGISWTIVDNGSQYQIAIRVLSKIHKQFGSNRKQQNANVYRRTNKGTHNESRNKEETSRLVRIELHDIPTLEKPRIRRLPNSSRPTNS